MRAQRKLRAVPDCPQPETPVKPVQYGAAPWSKLPPTPTADQLVIRARVQSMRSRGGKVAELLSYEDSLAWLREHNTPAAADAAAGTPSPANPLSPRAPGCRQGAQSTPAAARSARVPSRSRGAAAGFSTIAEWDAYYAGTGPRRTLPPF